MPLPANVTTLVVKGTFLTPEGEPSTGSITFTPTKWLSNSGANIAIPNAGVTKTLGTAGDFTAVLPVTDDTDLQPANWTYTVQEVVDGVSQSYSILLPGTAGSGGTVYLADIAPAAELGPEFASLQGPAGVAATLTVGTTSSVANAGTALVTNSGTSSAAILNFVLRDGPQGPAGAMGSTGPTGTAATVSVGTVTAGTAGGTPTVSNSGTSGAAVLDFVLIPGNTGPQGATGPTGATGLTGPQGDLGPTGPTGPQGATGTAATIAVGSVSTVAYGGTAAVANVGSSSAGTFDFTLVAGPQGDLAGLSATSPLSYAANTFGLNVGAGLTTSGTTLVPDFGTTSGKVAQGNDSRFTDARTPTAHASTHGSAGGDAITVDQSQVTNLTTDLAAKAALASPTFTGTPAAPTAAVGTDTTQVATTAYVNAEIGNDAVTKSLVNAKGDLVTATANDTPAILTAGSNGQMLMADSSATAGLRYVDPPANRNIVINGAMQVAQRNTSVTGITGDGYHTADRWATRLSTLGAWTQSIENDAPTGSGLRKSLKMLCTTSDDASGTITDLLIMRQIFEGQDLQRIKKGTASAEQLSLSFWVKSNVTGTYVVELEDLDNSRVISSAYTVTSSGTWERKTITFAADTTGAFDNDNSGSFRMNFWLAAGSNFSSGSPLNTSWASSISNTARATGQTNLAAATNNYWQITGVQLETGPVATPFEFEPYEATLRKCQRYYYLHASGAEDAYSYIANAAAYSASQVEAYLQFPTTMRTAPSLSATSATNTYGFVRDNNVDLFNSLTTTAPTRNGAVLRNNTEISSTAGHAGQIRIDNSATAFVAFSAEL